MTLTNIATKHSLCISLLFASIINLNAGENNYHCYIQSELSTTDNGILENRKKPLYIGNRFHVNKLSGLISGEPFSNLTAGKIEIVTQAGEGRNFEVLSSSSPNGRVLTDLIVIQSWNKSSKKPFTAISSSSVYSGICN